jgi:hypothetical protein
MTDPHPANVPERTFSPEEVAQTLGTSAWWVREQARSGRAAHLRVGKGRIRFTGAQVATLVDRVTVREDTTRVERQPEQVDASVLGATVRSLGAHRSHHSPAPASREAT